MLFASRSPIYRNENFISVRNSKITTQIKAIKFVIENGYNAIRVGRDKIDQFNINTKKFFDYTFADYQSDFLDIYIFSKARFIISGTTGINELATIMRIPELLVDFTFSILYLIDLMKRIILLYYQKTLFSVSWKILKL